MFCLAESTYGEVEYAKATVVYLYMNPRLPHWTARCDDADIEIRRQMHYCYVTNHSVISLYLWINIMKWTWAIVRTAREHIEEESSHMNNKFYSYRRIQLIPCNRRPFRDQRQYGHSSLNVNSNRQEFMNENIFKLKS